MFRLLIMDLEYKVKSLILSRPVNRVATMNNMTPSEAQDALQMWHSVYMGAAPMPTKEGIEDRVGPMRDAGYDYITWPEFASAAYFLQQLPPHLVQ